MGGRVPVLSSEASLAGYLEAIKKFPMLGADEEYQLATRFHTSGDLKAAEKLVTSHLRLVAKIAMGYRYYRLPVSDLISEGNLGLMRAVKKFEPERGFRLATYAMWWIKAAINEFVLNSWSLVKVGTVAAQKKLFFNLRKLKAKLELYDDGDIPIIEAEKIAKRLDVTTDEVIDMNRRLSRGDSSLNQMVTEDGDVQPQDLLIDDSPDQETVLAEREERAVGLKLMREALNVLTPRERTVIEQRRLLEDPRTLEDIGADFGISRERVRQIENKAFAKLQQAVKAAAMALENAGARALPRPA
ncbi:MAG: RNA polymerase sigma factor RpoH [Alphaproteobacteria bacterium]|nr:RNA polymerase sigma factor RpoH [Alphaproteobacteria bacterium]